MKSNRGYRGARKGEPCLTYKEFRERYDLSKYPGKLINIIRHRYRYYVKSWRYLNDIEE